MKKSIEYVQDNDGIWRVKYAEGFAESTPASFTDHLSKPPENEITKYKGTVGDYLRKQGARDVKYNSKLNRWNFRPIVF